MKVGYILDFSTPHILQVDVGEIPIKLPLLVYGDYCESESVNSPSKFVCNFMTVIKIALCKGLNG